MTQFQIVLQGIFGDLLTILVIPIIVAILVVTTIKDKGKVQTMIDDDDNTLRVSWKSVCLWTCISVGMWLVLIAVGYVFIRWAGR